MYALWAGIGLVGVLVLVFIAWPLTRLVGVGTEELATTGPAVLEKAAAGAAVANTVWTGLAIAALAVLIGAGAALLTERLVGDRKGWLRVGILLPILVPGFVSALSFIRAYGEGGLTDDLFGISLPGLFGPVGIVAVLAVNIMPIAYLVVLAALRSGAEPDMERAARVHGAGRLVALKTVVLPLLLPALLGSAALAFVAAINAFGAPAVLGTPAGFATVTTRIYQDLALSARPEAFSRAVLLALGLVVLALLFVLLAERLLRHPFDQVRTVQPGGQPTSPTRRGRAGTVALWVFVLSTTVVPLATLVLTSVTKGVGLAPVPANWTLGNYTEALSGRFAGALARSLLLSLLAAAVVVTLGSIVTAIRRRAAGRLFRSAILVTFAVPGSTLAVAVLLAYGATLRDTLLLIFVAYVAKLWAVGQRVIEGSAASLSPTSARAARASGAGPWATLRTVTGPLLAPALVGAGSLVFLFAFHELTMSSLLYGPGTDTLAVVILNLQQLGDLPVSSALAVLLTLPVLLVGVAVLAGRPRWTRRSGGGR